MKGFSGGRQRRSWSGIKSVPSTLGPLLWYLHSCSLFEFLGRKAVVEKYVSCQHRGNPSDAPFLYFDIHAMILGVTSILQANLGPLLWSFPRLPMPRVALKHSARRIVTFLTLQTKIRGKTLTSPSPQAFLSGLFLVLRE